MVILSKVEAAKHLVLIMSRIEESISPQRVNARQQLRARDIERMSFGLRLRNLRAALGWTESMAAIELGVNVRTVIRHEGDWHRTPFVRLRLLLRMRNLESA